MYHMLMMMLSAQELSLVIDDAGCVCGKYDILLMMLSVWEISHVIDDASSWVCGKCHMLLMIL